MSTFTTQPSATTRAAVLVVSLAMSSLCLGSVVVGFNWDVPGQMMVTQHTAPVHA
jgi:hypothetical protein